MKRLGDILIDKGWVRSEQVDLAIREVERTGERIGTVLLRLGLLSDEQLAQALAEQLGLSFSRLDDGEVDETRFGEALPFAFAEEHRVLPLKTSDGTFRLAMADPFDLEALDTLRRAFPQGRIEPVVAPAGRVQHLLAALDQEPYEAKVERLLQRVAEAGVEAEEGPVLRLLRLLLDQAVREGASDVHLEPTRTTVRVRFRFDGVLHHLYTFPIVLHQPLVGVIKMAAGLDIAKRYAPQDGKLVHEAFGRPVDVRVATYPGIHGENVILRLLDKATALKSLEELGYGEALLDRLLALLQKPHGILLLTGPTGSGKTTTLYACLQRLSAIEVAIMTIEDPVEYELPLVKQSQVNEKAEMSFVNALRAMLRSDPDVILVGEIRDRETAELACQAALTGHLVFSTLHTNSAPEAITRLLNLGIPREVLAPALRGVVAQRLCRTICPACAALRAPTEEELAALAALGPPPEKVREGRGCEACRRTGYRGRVAIAELIVFSPALRRQVARGEDIVTLTETARREGYRPLALDGLEKVLAGLTTVREVLRVAEFGPEVLG